MAFAWTDTVKVLEERVRNWNYYNDQDKPPTNLDDRYGLVVAHGFSGGFGRVTFDAPNDMIDAFMALVDAYGEVLWRNQPVDKSHNGTDDELRPRRAQRLDWLFDLVHEARLADPHKF